MIVLAVYLLLLVATIPFRCHLIIELHSPTLLLLLGLSLFEGLSLLHLLGALFVDDRPLLGGGKGKGRLGYKCLHEY